MSMIVVVPTDTTDATLISSNIPEDDYPVWSSETDYVIGDFVISTETHTVYRAMVDSGPSGTGPVNPDTETASFADPLTPDADIRTWQIIGATNRWRIFDKKPSVQSSQADEIDVTIAPGVFVDAVGLFNLNAASVQIIITDPIDGEVYNETRTLQDNTAITDWYEYFFEPSSELTDIVFLDLPPYANAEIQVIISRTGETAFCGQLVLGGRRYFGETTVDDSGLDGVDFSTVEQDIFGDLTTVKRAATRLNRYRIAVQSSRLQLIARVMRNLRGGRPAIFVGSRDDRIASLNYGFARDWRVDYEDSFANLSYMTIEVQGVV